MKPLDTLFYNATIADMFRLRLFEGWMGICDGKFVYVEEGALPATIQSSNINETHDLRGQIIMPGLIDAHMHIESSLITPRRFAQSALPYGTTTILSDPHEVGNVAGEAGVRWMIAASTDLPLRIYHAIPSCVPATSPELEWTAEVFDAVITRRLQDEPSVIALGEVMDYRGLTGENARLQRIVRAAQEAGLLIEGHIPTLRNQQLSEYLSFGIGSDHTLAYPEKINEQISKGLALMLQAKSITTANVAAITALPDRSRILLVTDDIEPPLLEKGHLSQIVEMAISAGMSPLEAFASATIRPACYLGLRQLGGIAPGYHADFMLMSRKLEFPPQEIFVNGRPVARNGECLIQDWPPLPPLPAKYPVPGPLSAEDFRLVTTKEVPSRVKANVVAVQNQQNTLTQLEAIELAVDEHGYAIFADDDQLALAAIFARNGSSRMVGIIKNTGLRDGAFASSVCHDSHNLFVTGRDIQAMRRAAQEVRAMGGGIAVAGEDALLAKLPLPFFGLLSDEPVGQVAQDLRAVEEALRSLGMSHQRPFLLLSIMGLSVSPYFKFTDKGVVDTERRTLLPAWETI